MNYVCRGVEIPVASLVEAWIETLHFLQQQELESLPSWKRGLKRPGDPGRIRSQQVASLVEAWIETLYGDN